ncbi:MULTISPECIES: glutamate 5-kinase [Halocynthiibacter]|uniref:Glutamate 5-kinase n=1 Tax=Halocynthiibacter halioticoli TaxID=2986804 RepID=A0AAE3IY70_9RHOB|nr:MULTISPECIES: glutamate 5-kinase [Halocynthiibacter]MCV6824283.1 glutamate 5-kinase [Halocynthiibacter halioticoli]MCW4057284.1 glutamate 5-kinase [Halocynthiibacter sp. SDUM655004]
MATLAATNRSAEALARARRVVVKIGSAMLVDKDSGALREEWLQGLARDVAKLKAQGADVVLVSSGSIALGRGVLGLPAGGLALEQSQAAAAVGQIRLARAYEGVLAPEGITTAQVLVTLEDSEDRRRYLNSRATLEQLLSFGTVPIVNENDTIATDEIRFGDNDRLAAQVAVTVGADVLVLLSDVDGFYSANPGIDPTAQRFDTIDVITPSIEAMAGDPTSGLSKGGMKTKVLAAKTATQAGCAMVISEGSVVQPITSLIEGAACTWFTAKDTPQAARKHWISAMKPRGIVTVDAGAAQALKRGKSLLPAGVTAVSGTFGRGDPVAVHGPDGQIATGLTRYTSEEAQQIKGVPSDQFQAILGYAGRAALIHRDDMVL